MKKAILLMGFVLVLGTNANAALIDQGSGVIFDNIYNQYWIQDLKILEGLSYDQQIAQIQILNATGTISGFSSGYGMDWHMATVDDITNLWAYSATELVDSFLPNSQITSSTSTYWNYAGRYDLQYDSQSHYYTSLMDNLTLNLENKGSVNLWTTGDFGHPNMSAWIVGTNAVPEPATLVLFSLGGVGLALRRRLQKIV